MKRSQRRSLGDDLLGGNTYAHEEQRFIVFAYGTALFCRGAQAWREFLCLDVGTPGREALAPWLESLQGRP